MDDGMRAPWLDRVGGAGFTLVEIMIVVCVIGILAIIAMPAFQRVRARSQDKAVLNNMRQLAAAADQYFLVYATSRVSVTALVGSANYLKSLNTVARESYPLTLRAGRPIIVTGIAGVRTLTYVQ